MQYQMHFPKSLLKLERGFIHWLESPSAILALLFLVLEDDRCLRNISLLPATRNNVYISATVQMKYTFRNIYKKCFGFASDNAGDSDGIGRDDFGENIDRQPCGVQSRLVGCAGQGASHCVSFKLWGLDSRLHTFT